jgi:precorrin-6B methylase 2
MLKIEQFVEQNFGIKLTKHQLEMIAIMAASPEREFILQNTGRSSGKTVAFKAAMAYLQDGMKPVSIENESTKS